MDVTVLIGTYGDVEWVTLAQQRAAPSAEALGVPVVHVHADTLHEARNACLAKASSEWVCWLDADDELVSGYFDRMAGGTADVRAPSVEYVVHGRRRPARMPNVAGHTHPCTADCLPEGNWLVVGSVVRRQLAIDVGGFRDWPIYEDWCLWLRCHLAGATIEAIPRAVYRAHVRSGSRNRAKPMPERDAIHRQIVDAAYCGAAS